MTHAMKPKPGCPHARCFSDCRPARPRCKAMRAKNVKWQLCRCVAYWYPHRKGGGLCGSPEKMNLLVYGANDETQQ